ncbi:MAG: DUF6600 domain-containing protein [Rhizobacter sp.]
MKHMPLAATRRSASSLAHWWLALFGLVLLSVLAMPAHAADEPDPPGRVGRLAELNGQVWVYATDTNEWIAAGRNRPVTTGDRLSTEADGRAELRIGSSVFRVGPNTEVEVLRLDDDHVNLHLLSGSVTARLRSREAANEFTLRTEEGRFVTSKAGQYRFDRQDDTSSATAVNGQARFESGDTALDVQNGQRIEFWKERGGPQYSITEPRRDEFSNWVASLDAREERSVSTRYVSAEMTGVEDLDRYGRWEPETEYGAVWVPRTVVAGWAPYRMGHWAWVRPWGWTWVDDAPWGFAPFHYGRWVWYRNAWGWAPGRYVARPVYAPALVAWVGGAHASVSVRVGGALTVGWFPLGPREVYVPGYRVSPRYVQNVNVTHVTNITNINTIVRNPSRAMADAHYVNRGQPRAVTVVPSQVVERRQPVAPAFSPVNERTLRDMTRGGPRAEAPVVAPPRVAPGGPRQDPRVSRPGEPRPGNFGRERGNDGPTRPPAVGAPPSPRAEAPDRRDGPDRRDVRDARDGRDGRDVRDGRDGRDNGRGRDAPVVMPAPTPAQPQNPGFSSGRPNPEPRNERPPVRADNPRQDNPRFDNPRGANNPRGDTNPRADNPSRGNPPGFSSTSPSPREERAPREDRPPREERRRHSQDASPPVQQPQPQPQPRPHFQAAPQVQAPAAPPPQVMRPMPQPSPPPVMQRREAPPQQQPEARQRGPEGRERADRGDRGERGERGERR